LKIAAIIQARMGSTRLPGKVLKDLAGETVLGRVVGRLRRCRLIGELMVATTDHPADDAIVAECRKCSVAVSRGDQDDVLDRYYRAAQLAKADVVVRITSDCPLIDPEITDRTINAFVEKRPDYASNVLVRTYPRGLDTEVLSVDALARCWKVAAKPYEREHVTPYIYEHPAEFEILAVTNDVDYSAQRWTLDTPQDLAFLRAVYSRLEGQGLFSWRDVIALLELHPELASLNRAVRQKELQES
jgi:spore coat polysaccharide biosynthesis protein SpsF